MKSIIKFFISLILIQYNLVRGTENKVFEEARPKKNLREKYSVLVKYEPKFFDMWENKEISQNIKDLQISYLFSELAPKFKAMAEICEWAKDEFELFINFRSFVNNERVSHGTKQRIDEALGTISRKIGKCISQPCR